jgi:DNA-binding NarL/FixJ family response regulator
VNRSRVQLVEDEDMTRERLVAALRSAPGLVVSAATASCAEARAAIAADPPDVLLVDLGLPDGDGTALIREVRTRHPQTEIMVITVFGDERSVISAIEAGAGGYLLKDGTDAEIVQGVLDLLQGFSPISPAIARHLLRRLRAVDVPAANSDPLRLSGREQEVLELLARGFRNGEIASALGITVHTVTTYVRQLYRKLEVGSRGEAVFQAVSRGLIQPER